MDVDARAPTSGFAANGDVDGRTIDAELRQRQHPVLVARELGDLGLEVGEAKNVT